MTALLRVASLALVAVAVLAIAGCDFLKRSVDIEAEFARANNLSRGDVVLLDGIEIGRIGDTRRTASGGIVASLRLEPEHAVRVHGDAVAVYADHPGTRRIDVHNPSRIGDPIAAGTRIRGFGTHLELGAWRAEQALRGLGLASEDWFGDTLRAIEDLGRGLQSYFESDEWKTMQADIQALMRSLEGDSRRAMENAARQLEHLMGEMQTHIEDLRRQGQESAARTLEQLLEALRRALEQREEEVIET